MAGIRMDEKIGGRRIEMVACTLPLEESSMWRGVLKELHEISNDGSKDKTKEFLKNLLRKHPRSIQFHSIAIFFRTFLYTNL